MRVLKPGGRLIVGECIDRHFVPLVRLLRYASAAEFAPGIRLGPPLCYLALFHRGRRPGQGS